MFLAQRTRHEAELCSQRPAKCKWECGEEGPFSRIQRHEADECSQRLVTCKNGCGAEVCVHTVARAWLHLLLTRTAPEQIRQADEDKHVNVECSHRYIRCPALCGARISLAFKAAHDKTCTNRVVACPEGCGAKLRQGDLAHHQKEECPLRLSPCGMGCGQYVRRPDMAKHKATVCTKRFVTCRHDMCEKVVRLTSSFAVRCCFRRSQWCVPLVQQLTCAVRACVRGRAGSIRQAGGAHEAPMPQATDVLPAGLRPNLHRTVRGFPQQARTFLLVHTCPQACDGPSHASDAWLARSVRACS